MTAHSVTLEVCPPYHHLRSSDAKMKLLESTVQSRLFLLARALKMRSEVVPHASSAHPSLSFQAQRRVGSCPSCTPSTLSGACRCCPSLTPARTTTGALCAQTSSVYWARYVIFPCSPSLEQDGLHTSIPLSQSFLSSLYALFSMQTLIMHWARSVVPYSSSLEARRHARPRPSG